MEARLNECPCSGKNMNYFLGPWVLLVILENKGVHGFEIRKILEDWLRDQSISFNLSGIYRHLKAFEERGVVRSEWDVSNRGPAKKRYFLTETGRECLLRWIDTLVFQGRLIGNFIKKVSELNTDLLTERPHG